MRVCSAKTFHWKQSLGLKVLLPDAKRCVLCRIKNHRIFLVMIWQPCRGFFFCFFYNRQYRRFMGLSNWFKTLKWAQSEHVPELYFSCYRRRRWIVRGLSCELSARLFQFDLKGKTDLPMQIKKEIVFLFCSVLFHFVFLFARCVSVWWYVIPK